MGKKLKAKIILATYIASLLITLTGCVRIDRTDFSSSTNTKINAQESSIAEDSSSKATLDESSPNSSVPSILPVDLPDQEESSENSGPVESSTKSTAEQKSTSSSDDVFDLSSVSPYTGLPYANVHDRKPYFSEDVLTTDTYIDLSDLDDLGRCGAAMACLGQETMPTAERGSIGSVKPTGWHTVKYDGIDGIYLYNRCHLLGYQLTGLNAEPKNLITGTRYMNVEGMEPFEDQIADYIEASHNHVIYRVTPIFTGNNLLADGVLMEAESVEDKGLGLEFCVYCYNVQPGITIDYATGDSSGPEFTGSKTEESTTAEGTETTQPAETSSQTETQTAEQGELTRENCKYVVNTNSGKFHKPSCSSVDDMSPSNTLFTNDDRDTLISEGYQPCKRCNP